MFSNTAQEDQMDKLVKLKRMRLIATGLLVLMAVIYLTLKRFDDNFLISCIVAFAEAAMIGALADWFAVVALFRHPLGMRWIPHTAIIQKNKDRIGESLADFVVSNFFTEELIKSKLERVSFSEHILNYVKANKDSIAGKAVDYLPAIVEPLVGSDQLAETVRVELKNKLREVELTRFINSVLPGLVEADLHVVLVKQLLEGGYQWVNDNKDKTLRIIEGINKTFSLPFVGDIVYNSIVKTLGKLIEDIEKGENTELNKEVLHRIPERWIRDFQNSKSLQAKVEKVKNDILDSELFDRFLTEKFSDIREAVLSYLQNSKQEMSEKLPAIFESLGDSLLGNPVNQEKADTLIKDGIAGIVASYRQEIALLISETVKNWPVEDMVEKMEIQVGGDLQYIRINGTLIGGLAGVGIHLLSRLF